MAEPGILFTAFEPSGDQLAAPAIAALRAARSDIPIFALGGPKMRHAGAELLETTTERAVMFAEAVNQWRTHRRRVKLIRKWLRDHPLAVHVPVDSPAANWAICRSVRDIQPVTSIVHLAAPQLWAWAPWRIRRLRRLTDHVLCVLPFEPEWFEARGVKASFVGHLICQPASAKVNDGTVLPASSLKLALLPGSRRAEIEKNWPTMLSTFHQLRAKHPELVAAVAVVDEQAGRWICQAGEEKFPPHMHIVPGRSDAVLRWADVALVVSGTATLQTAALGTPMVVLFRIRRLTWHLAGRWLMSIRMFSLPNLIAESRGLGRVVPEFAPHFGAVEPIVAALEPLLANPAERDNQRSRLAQVVEPYAGLDFARLCADHILAAGGWHRAFSPHL